jgi:DNA-binding response OmpR family regulator
VVTRDELCAGLGTEERRSTRNSLDLQIMRLRRRIEPIELAIRTVWGQGYVLEQA